MLRIARRGDPDHAAVDAALITRLFLEGARLYHTQQNIAAFWNVATRPIHRNGFGLVAADVDREVRAIEKFMLLLSDHDAAYREWRQLVVTHFVSGVKVHDARLAAVMKVNRLTHILTLNTDDFKK